MPNAGKRSIGAYGHMRAEGLRKGMLDLVLPAPIGPFGSCIIEHKVDTDPTAEQLDWARALAHMGNAVTFSTSFEHSREFLVAYCSGENVVGIWRKFERRACIRDICLELDGAMAHRISERMRKHELVAA